MPQHSVEFRKIQDEIKLLENAGMIVRFIIPELIEHKPNEIFGMIIRVLIIFDNPNE